MEIGQAIILLTVINLALLALVGGLFFYVRYLTRNRQRIQDKLKQHWADKIPHHSVFPVRACDTARFKRFWKFFPWDRTGLVFIGDAEAALVLIDADGGGIVRRFRPDAQTLTWIGRNVWPNGVLSWFSVQAGGERWHVTSETGLTVIDSLPTTRKIYTSLLPEQGGQLIVESTAAAGFALEKHPLSMTMLVLFLLLVVYALADTYFILDEDYPRYPFWLLSLATGLMVAAIGSAMTVRSRVPNGAGITLALLLAGAMALSVYPGMLRLNQLTASEHPAEYLYRVDRAGNRLLPPDDSLPEISFHMRSSREYWQQFDPEEPFPVELYKGGLGFYQVRMTPIYDRISAFYKQRRS